MRNQKSQKNNKFYEMFLDELRDVYSAETQIIDNMPKMIQSIYTKDLKAAFKKHLEETKQQKQRLEKVFNSLGETPKGEFCEGIQGLIKETEKVIGRSNPSIIEDAQLIGCAQKIEHYEIAAYGTLRTFAHHLGLDDVEDNLQEILDEESKTNKTLTNLAEGTWLTTGINEQAVR